jgi:hypothetical protein
MVHAVGELEIADRELRVIEVSVERVQLAFVDPPVLGDLRIEAFQGLEVVLLVGVVERLPEVKVLQLAGRDRVPGREERHGEQDETDVCRGHDLPVPELDAGSRILPG